MRTNINSTGTAEFNNNFYLANENESTSHFSNPYDKNLKYDDEINSFSRGLDWNPKSKAGKSKTLNDTSVDQYSVTLKSNFLLKKDNNENNPFTKNLNSTSKYEKEKPVSKSLINIDEIKLMTNRLRFLSDSSIKSLDSQIVAELRYLNDAIYSILEKSN